MRCSWTARGAGPSSSASRGATRSSSGAATALATATDTLVVLMAAGKLAETCAELIGGGRAVHEPAAIVQWAGTLEQRSVVGTLADLPALAAAVSIGPPATLVVGAVAAIASELAPAAPAGTAIPR